MTVPGFVPQDCTAAAGGADVEQVLLCDVDANGDVVGSAIAVYEYDGNGNPVGAPTFVDPATGAPYVVQGTLVPCPGGSTQPLTSQAKLLGATDTWTPAGDVVGTLTSITFTVLTGTVDLVDESGTVLSNLPAGVTMSWSVDDGNTLIGPDSITADAASSAVVHWTQR